MPSRAKGPFATPVGNRAGRETRTYSEHPIGADGYFPGDRAGVPPGRRIPDSERADRFAVAPGRLFRSRTGTNTETDGSAAGTGIPAGTPDPGNPAIGCPLGRRQGGGRPI